eukprot:5184098-Alexandrium_andersonii.AAC.1
MCCCWRCFPLRPSATKGRAWRIAALPVHRSAQRIPSNTLPRHCPAPDQGGAPVRPRLRPSRLLTQNIGKCVARKSFEQRHGYGRRRMPFLCCSVCCVSSCACDISAPLRSLPSLSPVVLARMPSQ